ncbi:helix-turn-helix domain-containing protein [Yinghuangia seranimata]|uniref:helix-turn-helix domain-containing protein n=1 Tax=Yinghuangia seranimata TaxID=408067 RepID=UPI00248BCD26|nr:helix-turn-helix domain-containing protein [Yinghuangia seranimata]MDI2129077.1 helix-turn-helix domain-containing protein [Yinghuangia seranimata]
MHSADTEVVTPGRDGGGDPAASFVIRDGYAVYEGPSAAGGLHAHAAYQVLIAVEGEAGLLDAAGRLHTAPVLVVAPMTPHRMVEGAARLRAFYVEPHSAFAAGLRARCPDGITAAPELADLHEGDVRAATPAGGGLDPRLVGALDLLASAEADTSMPGLAAAVGISPQRLRALARDQLGMPLARWRVWLRLRRAAEALCEGHSLAAAATAGGFADQAHFTRRMRETMGLTPAAVLPILRS